MKLTNVWKVCLIIYVSLFLFLYYLTQNNKETKIQQIQRNVSFNTKLDNNAAILYTNPTLKHILPSVALIVVYVGNSLPLWINTFLLTAMRLQNQTRFTWFLFVVCEFKSYEYEFVTKNRISRRDRIQNINIVYISKRNFYNRLVSLYNSSILLSSFEKSFDPWPYAFVEFKPCLGQLFEEYISHYSHWGYADLDLFPGNLDKFITSDLLDSFDIYTSSFGDQNRLYLRGQLTIFKKNHDTIHLWQKCNRLFEMKRRITNYLEYLIHPQARWPFESAEGCFSHAAILLSTHLSVYFDTTQLSDAFVAPLADREAFVYPGKVERCNQKQIQIHSYTINTINTTRTYETKLENIRSLKSCSYWINPTYQVCFVYNLFLNAFERLMRVFKS